MTRKQRQSKRGRQPIKDPRNNQFRIRMNDHERDLFFEASDLAGLSHTDTMREAIRRMVFEERERTKRSWRSEERRRRSEKTERSECRDLRKEN